MSPCSFYMICYSIIFLAQRFFHFAYVDLIHHMFFIAVIGNLTLTFYPIPLRSHWWRWFLNIKFDIHSQPPCQFLLLCQLASVEMPCLKQSFYVFIVGDLHRSNLSCLSISFCGLLKTDIVNCKWWSIWIYFFLNQKCSIRAVLLAMPKTEL